MQCVITLGCSSRKLKSFLLMFVRPLRGANILKTNGQTNAGLFYIKILA
jgi:hypothetical protein